MVLCKMWSFSDVGLFNANSWQNSHHVIQMELKCRVGLEVVDCQNNETIDLGPLDSNSSVSMTRFLLAKVHPLNGLVQFNV